MLNERSGTTASSFELPIAADFKLEMAWCPSGEFVMGSEEGPLASWMDKPAHEVAITKGFWISKTLITEQQWIKTMHAPKRLFSHSSEDLPFPAEGMSWDEAIDFCRLSTAYLRQQEHLGPDHEIDLPSEAEWEYACRAGTTSPWHFGEDPSALADYGWYRDNSSQTKHPVALKKPNPWGIYDLY